MNSAQVNGSILFKNVQNALKEVIDPETQLDVLSMRLIKDLRVNEQTGNVSLIFRPTSPYCPLAYTLGLEIKKKILTVEGIKEIEIQVEGYVDSQKLQKIISEG